MVWSHLVVRQHAVITTREVATKVIVRTVRVVVTKPGQGTIVTNAQEGRGKFSIFRIRLVYEHSGCFCYQNFLPVSSLSVSKLWHFFQFSVLHRLAWSLFFLTYFFSFNISKGNQKQAPILVWDMRKKKLNWSETGC